MAYTETSDNQRPCARGERCYERSQGHPALGPRAFCATDQLVIARSLAWLPEAFVLLHGRIGDKSTGNSEKVSTSRTASIPLNLAVDTLLTDMVGLLESWAERVRDVARLSGPTTDNSRRRRDAIVVADATRILTGHLDVLLALPEASMARFLPLHLIGKVSHDTPGTVLAYAAITNPDLSGADAGLEILHLHARARGLLGLTPKHQDLPVPCWSCGLKTVRRWDGAAGLSDSAECSNPDCKETYTNDRYLLLIADVAEQQRSKESRQASA